jgi:hypothetical protein
VAAPRVRRRLMPPKRTSLANVLGALTSLHRKVYSYSVRIILTL